MKRGELTADQLFVRCQELEAKIAALPKPEPVAWCIRFKSDGTPDGFVNVHYHGTNAIADYRTIDPAAVSEPLYTNAPDSAARIKELEAEVSNWRNLATNQEQLTSEASCTIQALKENLRVAREALKTGVNTLYEFCDSHGAEHNWEPDVCHIANCANNLEKSLTTIGGE